jgi:acetylornithine/succinyldiaminopimelate/putrescine aminotransferase/predicted amino acid dehydrogenase
MTPSDPASPPVPRQTGTGSRRTVVTRAASSNGAAVRPATVEPDDDPVAWNAVEAYGHLCRPGVVPLLSALGLDAVYERGEGDILWLRRNGRLVPIVDLVGGYGANLFGHHHPDLVAAARRCFDEQLPFQAQASCRPGAARLAEALCHRLGDYVVTLTNSGTESVEAAIKHALLERPKPTLWAVRGAFHGKTLGSIQLTWSYRGPYVGRGPRVRFLDPHDPRDWEAAAAEVSTVAAILLEPIAGEGGIRRLPSAFVEWVLATCRPAGVPVIVDEIQSGMGRTGTFLASEALGIDPDYICLAKALGGGIAKIGALLVRRERFVEEFSLRHTSTFAEDEYGCAIAVEALRVMERDNLPARCRARGAFLLEALRGIQARFPDQVKDVRGHGLMVGFELQDRADAKSYTLRMLSRQGYLGYAAAAYLLNVHDLRVAPTLGDPRTLRLEPSAYVTEEALTRFVRGAEQLCAALRAENVATLTGHVVGLAPETISAGSVAGRPDVQQEPRTPARVGFIGHLLLDEHVTMVDPSYRAFGADRLEEYLDRTARVVEPIVFDRIHVRSRTGQEVHLSFVGLGLTSRQFARAREQGGSRWITEKIETAVQVAKAAGCRVVGFGGYTSIVTGNCRRVRTNGVALTTGNSLTVGMGVAALREAARAQGIDVKASRLAVLGAAGNIASTYAVLMAPEVREVVLIVRNLRSPKIAPIVAAVREASPQRAVRVVDDLAAMADCPLIVAASNTPEPLIHPEHVGPGPVVICDISLPSDVAPEVVPERPDVLVVTGGVVRLPQDDDFSIGGVPLPGGHVFACMAETLLMGLEQTWEHGSVGSVTAESVRHAMAMAEKHGFAVGDIHANTSASRLMSLGYAQHRRRRTA